MNDFDHECDATRDAALRNIAESNRLAEAWSAAVRAKTEWEADLGLTREKRQRFFAALSPEDRKKVDEENERFQRDMTQDLEQATGGAAAVKPGGGHRRHYV